MREKAMRANGQRPEILVELLTAAGGVMALAKKLEISGAAVSKWRSIPIERVVKLEEITSIPRERLRPDIFMRGERIGGN
jgi:DNA-binding transcriptional regulator YdaS (Cro superfamily)